MALLDTLHSRGLPQTTYHLRAVPSSELWVAQRAVDEARTRLHAAEAERRVTSAHRQAFSEAEDRLAACFTPLTLRAMLPDELEGLLAEHKPIDDEPNTIFNQKTFMPALLARCVYDAPDAPEPALTEDQWAAEIAKGSMSLGEATHLFSACWEVNDRSPNPDLPKG